MFIWLINRGPEGARESSVMFLCQGRRSKGPPMPTSKPRYRLFHGPLIRPSGAEPKTECLVDPVRACPPS